MISQDIHCDAIAMRGEREGERSADEREDQRTTINAAIIKMVPQATHDFLAQ